MPTKWTSPNVVRTLRVSKPVFQECSLTEQYGIPKSLIMENLRWLIDVHLRFFCDSAATKGVI